MKSKIQLYIWELLGRANRLANRHQKDCEGSFGALAEVYLLTIEILACLGFSRTFF